MKRVSRLATKCEPPVERLIKLFKNSTNKPKIERKLPAAERSDEHAAFKYCLGPRVALFKTDRKFEGFSKVLVNSSYLLAWPPPSSPDTRAPLPTWPMPLPSKCVTTLAPSTWNKKREDYENGNLCWDISPGCTTDTSVAPETLLPPQSQPHHLSTSLQVSDNLTGVDSCRLNPWSGARKQGCEPFLLNRPGAWKVDIYNDENCREIDGGGAQANLLSLES